MENSKMDADDLAWFRAYRDKTFWKPARTYANTAPHSYTVREWVPDDQEFVAAVQLIRHYGSVEYFYRKPFLYLYLDGLKYWTMGEPIEETTLINCCPWENTYRA